MKIDKSLIKELSGYLDEFKLTEIEFTEKDTKIKVSKNNQPASNVQNTLITKENDRQIKKVNTGLEVKSPIIGTAYHSRTRR